MQSAVQSPKRDLKGVAANDAGARRCAVQRSRVLYRRCGDGLARLICGKGTDRLRRVVSGNGPTQEGWPSGLRRTPGKRVGVKAPRGFESPSLRHTPLLHVTFY